MSNAAPEPVPLVSQVSRVLLKYKAQKAVRASSHGHGGGHCGDTAVVSLSWSGQGDMLAFALRSGQFGIWGLDTPEASMYWNTTEVHDGYIRSLNFTHHPSVVMYGAMDRTKRRHYARMYDVQRESEIFRYPLTNCPSPVTQLALSPTHDYFLMGQSDGAVSMYDLRAPAKVETICEAGSKANTEGNVFCWRGDGMQLASTLGKVAGYTRQHNGSSVFLFDVRKLQANRGEIGIQCVDAPQVSEATAGGLLAMEYSPCMQYISVKRTDGTVATLAVDAPAKDTPRVRNLTLVSEDHTDFPIGSTVTYSRAGALCTGNDDGTITAWRAPHEKPDAPRHLHSTSDRLGRHPASVGPIRWNPVYNMMVSACHVIFLWTPKQAAPPAPADT